MFSRATIMDIMYLLREMNTHATLGTYAFRYGLDARAIGGTKDERVMNIGKYLLENPQAPGILSDSLSYEIVEDVIGRTTTNEYIFDPNSNEFVDYPQLRRLLL